MHSKDRDAHQKLSEETQARMMAFHRADVHSGIDYSVPKRGRKGFALTAILILLAALLLLSAWGVL